MPATKFEMPVFDPIPVSGIDANHMLYGNFIGVQYVLPDRLDKAALEQAWQILLKQFPAMAGRFNRQQIVHSQQLPKLKHQSFDEGLETHARIGSLQDKRTDYVDEPPRKDVLSGRAPLSTLTLSEFNDGAILGLAVSHVISDAGGFHKIAGHLAKIYSSILSGKAVPQWPLTTSLPEFKFGTQRDWAATKTELTGQNLSPPLKLSGAAGFLPRQMVLWAMNKIASQNRMVAHLEAVQVAKLKETVLTESSEDWISTNAALCAHFASVLIKLIHGDSVKKPIRMGQLLDLRGRYFEDTGNQQNSFVGNAILIHTDKPDIETYDRPSLARFFKSSITGLTPDFLKARLDVIADCLRHGRTYPGLEFTDPLLAVNNQTKMPVYDIAFGGISPSRIIPQDVGDNIMFFPAPDGGVEVYIRDILNPKRQASLETPKWQARLFDF